MTLHPDLHGEQSPQEVSLALEIGGSFKRK